MKIGHIVFCRSVFHPSLARMLFYSALFAVFTLGFVNCHVVMDLSSPRWNINNGNKTIVIHGPVPGGVYSTLEDNAMIGDILFGKNDINYRWIGNEDWTYFTEFELNSTHLSYPSIQLVLHGIDTLAEVHVNNHHILSGDNMFLRYNYEVKALLKEGINNMSIDIQSPIKAANQLATKVGYTVPPVCHPPSYRGECNINMLRKMQASFSWDWGPAIPSSGVWKPVELALSEGPVIRSVGVHLLSEGSYWRMNVTVWFDDSDLKLKDTVFVELSKPNSGLVLVSGRKFSVKNSGEEELKLSILIAKSKVDLWWPNGYGEQNLYDLRVYYTHSEKRIKVGFRTIELIQESVSQNEAQGKTFYFLVNGIKLFAKGSNWIPSHILPERLSDATRIVPILEAAASSHFNMLRVWGGGVYESELFYETCDRLGILIWQDLMFACSMYPVGGEFIESVKKEVKQQIQRLQHYPSIAIWAGNNENEAALSQNWYGTASNLTSYKSDYIKLYVETIMPIVKSSDPSREYVTSSPSNGMKTETEGYVSKNPQDSLYGDVHYYNYLSNGWDYRIYPNPRFASEYGIQSLPTFHCLQSALPLGEMKWESRFLDHRQHAPAGNTIIMNQITQNLPRPNNIADIIYMSHINQAMAMKTESEKYRRLKSILLDSGEGLTMGALYWQLSSIWQAPDWSSIDYCGNWKMLQYYSKDFFAPIIVTSELSSDGTEVSVYVVIDGNSKYHEANVTINIYNWSATDWKPFKTFTSFKTLIDNGSFLVSQIALTDASFGNKDDYFLTASLEVNGEAIAPENFLFLSLLVGKYPETSVKISDYKLLDNRTAELTLTADKFALFVWLDLDVPLEGVFSNNGFHMFQPSRKITFNSKYPLDETSLKKISVTWLKQSYS